MKLFLVALIIICTPAALYAAPKAAPKEPPKPPQYTLSPNANPATKALFQQGVITCGNQIERVTNYLVAGGDSGGIPFVAPADTNHNMVSTSMEVIDKNKNYAYTTETFAPNSAGGCSSIYDAVKYWPQECEKVISKQLGENVKPVPLRENIKVVKIDPNTRLFIMPAGDDGCITIKKEVVF